jgi:hypothetical protein
MQRSLNQNHQPGFVKVNATGSDPHQEFDPLSAFNKCRKPLSHSAQSLFCCAGINPSRTAFANISGGSRP